jgi:mRNA interferase HigB
MCSQIWEHQVLKVYGESTMARFARKHPASRRPLQRFLEIVRESDWPHFTAVRQSFAAADYAPSTGTLIFDIGGNKYRLMARVDFGEQVLYIQSVLTHDDYDRESL